MLSRLGLCEIMISVLGYWLSMCFSVVSEGRLRWLLGLFNSSSCGGCLVYSRVVSVVFSCLLLLSVCSGCRLCLVFSLSRVRCVCRLF